MRGIDLKSLGVGLDEVEAALAREAEPWLRKRLFTLQALLDGRSPEEAAQLNSVSIASVRRWRKWAASGGLQALLRRGHGVKQSNSLLPMLRCHPTLRDDVATALAANHYPYLRNRLLAIQAVLDGETISAAAHASGVARNSLGRSLKLFYDGGAAHLLAHTHIAFDYLASFQTLRPLTPRRIHFYKTDPARIEAARAQIAAALPHQTSRRLTDRLLAVDEALAGETIDQTAATARVKPETLRVWVRKILKGGISAVIPAPRSRIDLTSLGVTEHDITAALAAEQRPRIQKRLSAILGVLQGRTVPDAARAAEAKATTLTMWLKRLRRDGLGPLLVTYSPKARRPKRPMKAAPAPAARDEPLPPRSTPAG
jgi:transposase-like protein